jgi:anti-sigma-K factor RskA
MKPWPPLSPSFTEKLVSSAAPEGKTYQIWVIDSDGAPRPSGLFEPGGDALAAVVEHPVEITDTVAVTVEPEGALPSRPAIPRWSPK